MSQAPPRIFDPAAGLARRRRAALLGGDVFLAQEAAEQIAARIGAINRTFEHALDLESCKAVFPVLEPLAKHWLRTGPQSGAASLVADNEAMPFAPESFDLVVSVLSLHAVNDLPGVLAQIRHILKPDGLFIAALFGGETLRELRLSFAAAESENAGGASPRVAPFGDVRDLGGLLQRAKFTLPVADVERSIVRYRDLTRLFADLRHLGETNVLAARRKSFLTRGTLAALAREYATRFADAEGRVAATFDIVYLTGWAAHDSQQQPLAPGAAKHRLADALETVEIKTGEKAQPPRQ